MKNPFGLTPYYRRFLASKSKSESMFTNPSQTFIDLHDKTRTALELLTKLADPVLYTDSKDTRAKTHDVFLPTEKYDLIMPSKQITEFMRSIINGRNRCDSTGQTDKLLDLYGTEIATECLDYCIRKLERQWRAAIVANKEHLHDFEASAFSEDMRGILSWSRMVYDKVKLAKQKQEAKLAEEEKARRAKEKKENEDRVKA